MEERFGGMEQKEAFEAYDLLLIVCRAESSWMIAGYKQMRDLLERICRMQMENGVLQMTDLAARINFVSVKLGLSVSEQNCLHTFRLTSNDLLNHRAEPTRACLLRDVKTLALLVRKISGEEIPSDLLAWLPQTDAPRVVAAAPRAFVQRMRVCFQYADEDFLYVTSLDELQEEPLRVRYNVPQQNDEFAETCQLLWKHAQVNLLDVSVDEEGILTPSFIVLEPDYLLDISSLAECFHEYGHHPLNYFLSRLRPIENARPLLLGNIANLFLDEWIYARGGELDFRACMQKAFRRYPIELAACTELYNKENERNFFQDCFMHFEHIRDVVTQTFHESGYQLDQNDAVLEPSYICEALGLQGRLDYMQRDMSAFIEMKSGKGDEYAFPGKVVPKENNQVQMLLYQAVLQYSMGMDHRKVKPYLLYTRYPLLYPSRSSWAMVRRVIDLRNRIVAEEYGIQLRNNLTYTAERLEAIHSSVLNEKKLSGYFWENYLRPSIDDFSMLLNRLTELEKRYFYALYNFITKELYTSKSGDIAYEGRTGAASLWLSTLEEKCDSGEIIYNLRIRENHAADEHKAYLVFDREEWAEGSSLPNFRLGDAIVLYERNQQADNVTNKMVFKGSIERLNDREIKVRLRAAQQNTSVLPEDSLYAIEHDTMDTSFRFMYHGLYAFLTTTQRRRDVLLAQRLPEFDESWDVHIASATDDFTRIAWKAKAASDYFLLVGPPGTGKTSCALKKMVETFYQEDNTHILLLSYTNRAVDEICKSLCSIVPQVDFMRVGSELSCDEAYRPYLMENALSACTRRVEVYERIRNCRIIVGTVAAISGKPELFRLKHFQVAIVDESTQILEPQLLGILCARGLHGGEAIDKFILIGDHKQLPAVVLQSSEQSVVMDECLQEIGLSNLKDSLFERLYRRGRQQTLTRSYDMLCRQGRMHPVVAQFANQMFYEGRLMAVGLPHQLEEGNVCRLAFYPSVPEKLGLSAKTNHSEADIVARLAARIYRQYQQNQQVFDEMRTLGIITPYRSQIALIKQKIETLGIPALNHVLIDTVERFQGSERDIIIYSFCVNYPYQLKFLCNLTEEDGVMIDRKLNVALTRARKQMFITGVPSLLKSNPLYKSLLNLIEGS